MASRRQAISTVEGFHQQPSANVRLSFAATISHRSFDDIGTPLIVATRTQQADNQVIGTNELLLASRISQLSPVH